MRVQSTDIHVAESACSFEFDGRTIEALTGETIAAALTANGILALRRARSGEPRGIFCGMGVCSECLVSVDGEPNVRACMTPVRPGMKIMSQGDPAPAPESLPPAGPNALADIATDPDVLIVGGGPAGLQAALAAARAGARVLVVDERPYPGGQYFKQLAPTHAFASPAAMDTQFRQGRDLIDAVRAHGVTILSNTQVWGAFGTDQIGIYQGLHSAMLSPKRLIVATGAYERGVPVPGWTLPGYMTTGAAQTLLRAYRVSPGKRVLMAGNGPLNLQVARELTSAGVTVVAWVEASAKPGVLQAGALLQAAYAAPDLILAGYRDLAALRRAGVPALYGHAVIEAQGQGKVERAVVARIDGAGKPVSGSERTFDVDAICAGWGFQPSLELSRALGCEHRFDPTKGTLIVVRGDAGETSVPGVFVVGDGGGMGGSRIAQEQGLLAGCKAAQELGCTLPIDLAADAARSRAGLVRHRRFQNALWTIFSAPRITVELAQAGTHLCRCEEVSVETVRQARTSGTSTIGGIKRQTRIGMGRCQGRYCGPNLVQMIADPNRPHAYDELDFFAPRPPIKPVPLAAIAKEPTP
jgi:NADPH-dependent 2,4-dienoyl-CoA reductase/sulfur reductase-like enzyme